MSSKLHNVSRAYPGQQLTGGVVVADDQGVLLEWSAEALRMHGFESLDEVRKQIREFTTIFEIYTLSGVQLSVEDWPLSRVMRGEIVDNVELRLHRIDRRQDWFINYSGLRIVPPGHDRPIYVITLQDVTAWHEAHVALDRSERAFHQLADAMPQIVWAATPNGEVDYYNRRFYEIADIAPGAANNASWSALLHPDDLTMAATRWHASVASGRPFECEYRCRDRATGGYRWYLGRADAVRDEAGRVTRWFGTLVDIDDVKRAEIALRESAAELRDKQALLLTLVEGITDPLYVRNKDGTYRYVNAEVARLAGRTIDDCIGRNAVELFGPKAGRRAIESDRRALESDQPVNFEESYDDGRQLRHFLVTKLAFRDASGSPAGVVGFSRDITSRRRAEEALEQSERHLRDVLDTLPVAVVVISIDGKTTAMNAVAATLARFDLVDSKTYPQWNSLPWFASGISEATLDDVMSRTKGGETVHLPKVSIERLPGPTIFDLTFAPMRDSDGAVSHLILTALDVSEREAAESRAREQQAHMAHLERVQTMGHMASGLAHELNQPLGAIVNYAAAGRHSLGNGEVQVALFDAILADIVAEGSRAGEIIRRLRKFVQKQRPQVQPVDPESLVSESLRFLGYELRQAGIEPQIEVAHELPEVLADAVQITQVLVNFVRNAMDAMEHLSPEDKQLRIRVDRAPAQAVRITVSDNGSGVSPSEIGRLFDAFYTTKSSGMGMGLALCRMIVEDHGGHISAHCNTPRGMQFSFTLRPAVREVESDDSRRARLHR